MNTSNHKSVIVKPLSIDFDHHTDGDEEFKQELIVLMIDNVKELQQSLSTSISLNNIDSFRETCHKVKPTISILSDQDLIDVIESIKHETNEAIRIDSVRVFNKLCDDLIKNLEEEMK